MIKGLSIGAVALAVMFTAVTPASGQSSVLQVSVTAGGATSPVVAGGSVGLTATGIGQPVLATVTVLNTGTAPASITGVSITGTSEMSVSVAPTFPVSLSPNGSTSFTVQYVSSTGNLANGQVAIAFTQNGQASSFVFVLTGTSPLLAYTYYFAPTGSLTNLNSGDRISFPATNLGSTSTAVVNVLNLGTATGSLQSVNLGGSGFQLSGSPAPTQLSPGQQASFNVTFTPQAVGTNLGLLVVGLVNSSASFTLTGTGTTPSFAFTYTLADGNVHSLTNGLVITFPSVDINGTSTAAIDILNQGTGTGTVTNISVSGTAFRLIGLPTLPGTIGAGQDLKFQIVFAPTQTGNYSGTFSINLGGSSISGSLTASTNPANFTASYTLSDGNVHPLTNGIVITFPSVDINATSTATIDVLNQGTGTGTVTGISVSGTAFRLSGLPILPATIGAGQDLRFQIVFAPTQTGNYSGTFSINLGGSSISGSLTASTNPPNLTASYILSDGIARTLSNGVLIAFPTVDVNGTTTATVIISNPGTGTGTVSGITLSGTGFRLTGVPVLPANVAPSQTLQFSIVFAPTQTGAFTGSFQINMSGVFITGTLSGSTTAPAFAVTYTLADGIVHALPNGTTVSFPPVDINGTTTATIDIVNQGTGAGSVTAIVAAGTGFRLNGVPLLPLTVGANQDLKFGIVFAPTQAGSYAGTFSITLAGSTISGTLTAATATSNISLAYVDPNTNNIIALSDGSTLPFPDTLVNSTANITLLATNNGAGTGTINSITLGGSSSSAFQLQNLPSFPVSVPPSQQVRFAVRFSPLQQQAFSGAVVLAINSQTTTINFQAQGTGPQFTYTWSNGTGSTALSPGGALALADTAVGQTTSVTISILNAGTGDGQILSIGVNGQGFTVTNLPTFPLTLHSKGSQSFTLTFAPTQPGSVNGTLTVGSDTFTVTGTGIGSRLIYTYTNAASAVTVTDGGVVIFPPTAVQSAVTVNFSIQNNGTSAATISSINLAAPATIFVLQQLPGLPLNLSPGNTITFSMNFVPNNTGSLTATLQVNTASFTLSGTGTQPAPLPTYQFQGPSGAQAAAQQPSIGLTFAAPYPFVVQGTLTLTFVSAVFTDDPSIQFATGGRTVNFTIPANATTALFNGTATALPLQTGTTAGNIVITPSFATQSGFNLTPASPNTLTLTIASSAPQLSSASITSETLTSFTLILSGYSTPRSLQKLDVQLTPKQGAKFSTSTLSIDLSSAAAAWFQGATSQTFGGSFLIAIPFTLQNGSTTEDLVHELQSLNITASNSVGASSVLSVPIP